MNFASVKSIAIPQGIATKIVCNGLKLWEAITFKNWVPHAIGTDKKVLNGCGYVGKTRLSSSGSTKENAYTSTTGFIPASSSAVIRVPTEIFSGNSDYVCAYKSDFSFISAVNASGSYGGGTIKVNGKVTEITLLSNSDIAYVRVSCTWGSGDTGYAESSDVTQGPCANMIVTVNEDLPL